jgi:hypothetical protein
MKLVSNRFSQRHRSLIFAHTILLIAVVALRLETAGEGQIHSPDGMVKKINTKKLI